MRLVHVHVYDETPTADDNLVVELDAEHTGTYEDYEQFGFHHRGEWIELRVPREGGG